MSGSNSLNLANYTTVWNDDFATDTQINSSIWPITWGNADDFAFGNGSLTLTSYASEGWGATGFIQQDSGASASQGYGLYSATASANAGEGVGICVVMWPSDNNWPGPEIDLVEDWNDPTRQTGYATIHWAGAGDSNGQDIHQFSVNLTQPNTFAMDWEPGALTYYVNGQEAFQVTGSEVPKDAADGGVNEAFGAEVTAAGNAPVSSSVSLHLYDMSYSAYTPGSGSAASTPAPAAAPAAVVTPAPAAVVTPAPAASPAAVDYAPAGSGVFYAAPNAEEVACGVNGKTDVISGAGDTVVLGATDNQVLALSSGSTYFFEGPGNQLYDEVGGNTLAFDPAQGAGLTFDNTLSDGDVFDLRYALNSSGYGGNPATLSSFLSVVSGTWGMELSIHPAGGAGSTPLLYVMGSQANIGLGAFLQHALV